MDQALTAHVKILDYSCSQVSFHFTLHILFVVVISYRVVAFVGDVFLLSSTSGQTLCITLNCFSL